MDTNIGDIIVCKQYTDEDKVSGFNIFLPKPVSNFPVLKIGDTLEHTALVKEERKEGEYDISSALLYVWVLSEDMLCTDPNGERLCLNAPFSEDFKLHPEHMELINTEAIPSVEVDDALEEQWRSEFYCMCDLLK